MSDLQHRPGGSLKLKGDDGGKKKKSKKKNASKLALTGEEPIKSEALLKRVKDDDETPVRKMQSSARDSPSAGGSGSGTPVKTEAERRFEETQRRRLLDKVSKMASKTHKDRVSEFNSKLESLSEHHDIPKVGPG
ncbi:hypothetical protein M408DRAFT_325679 [Serendipita vermifera MAFF 305830]|uniref:DUF1754-domain-containing protein n=1 Tax=Serendipita vermifera MAFF 305830 TaxID=933852 RepID=A0A0C2X838_SERVB|nr:hypothetical protein M408DRAFT_325679 [Serendipita vermifera MAFF 305830]